MREALTEVRKWIWTVPLILVLALLASWVAGQCRDWKKPEQPETIPGHVDPGTPVPGPAAEAPTAPVDLPPVTAPVLSRAELERLAKKYGLVLVPVGERVEREPVAGDGDAAPGGETQPEGPPDVSKIPFEPIFLVEERFGPGPAGDWVDASAWFMGEGQRLDLRAAWQPYTPPPVEVCPPVKGGWFGNEARWSKSLGVGYGVGRNGAGLAGRGSIDYLGPRTGAVTWGAGAAGMFVNSPDGGDYAAVVTFNATW